MYWRRITSMISTRNDYASLKWPLMFTSFLLLLVSLISLSSLLSNKWFTYESVYIDNKTLTTVQRVEYGHFGLWSICVGHYEQSSVQCDLWTEKTRPFPFKIIIVCILLALLFSNLTLFPSLAVTILILYNTNNRYLRAIIIFISILFILILFIAILLFIVVLYTLSSPFYDPGIFSRDGIHLIFHVGKGLMNISFGTFLSFICVVLIAIILIWQKLITIRLIQAEKDLLKQMSEDGFQPGWYRMVMAPQTPTANDQNAPPPYDANRFR